MVQKNLDLYKLIDNLKNKIKKLDMKKTNCTSNIQAYKISYPNKINSTKKYIGLIFNENFDDFNTESINSDNNLSFIKLKKNNCIINYSLTFEINNISNSSTICSISLGIKDKKTSKVRIIKGSKIFFDVLNSNINNHITINNTVIYISNNDDELCMIGEFNNKIKLISKKSLIKILTI